MSDLSRSMVCWAFLMSRVNTEEPRPNSESFARSIASSRLLTRAIGSSGPNVRSEPIDGLLGFFDVAREYGGAQAKLRVIRTLDRLVQTLDASNRKQRAKCLLPPHPGVWWNVGDDRRRKEEAPIERLPF